MLEPLLELGEYGQRLWEKKLALAGNMAALGAAIWGDCYSISNRITSTLAIGCAVASAFLVWREEYKMLERLQKPLFKQQQSKFETALVVMSPKELRYLNDMAMGDNQFFSKLATTPAPVDSILEKNMPFIALKDSPQNPGQQHRPEFFGDYLLVAQMYFEKHPAPEEIEGAPA